ncbi:hypothetical protein [Agriterribacter sp.]|uniref:hypothetical protein n=1 Tax=Agriterribacter sp. TaxID=2821509 RepID=UPI002C5D65B3|nr:hypothetical protein [Agriterribacter sp.]HTN07080.1 hypothetical protein [Agriterribacter sp.]
MKNRKKVIFILALLAVGALIIGYATHTYKRAMNDVACSRTGEAAKEEEILQSDIPFLESLTRRFLILQY